MGSLQGPEPCPSKLKQKSPKTVTVSYYGNKFAGRPTASGELFDPSAMTAAHKKLPFGTLVELRNPACGSTATVKINDRGPHVPGRELDISEGAAKELGISGVAKLEMRVVGE